MKFKEISTMGKVAIYLTAIMVVVFGIAFGVFFSPGILHAQGNYERDSEERQNINEMEETSSGNISSVIIDTSSPDVVLQPSSGNKIQAELKGYLYPKRLAEGTPILRMTESGGRVSFKTEFPKGIGFREINLTLTISVPESFSGDIILRTASGDIEAAGHKLKELEVKTASGEVSVRTCSLSSLQIKTASGDVEIDSVKSDNIIVDTTSGTITFDTVSGKTLQVDSTSGDFRGIAIEAENFSRDTSSGDTRIDDFTGKFYCKSVSGTIAARFTRFDLDIEVRSTSGDVELELPHGSGFDLDIETTSGDIDCDWPITMTVDGKVKDNRLTGTVGDGGPEVTIKTTSGDVDVIEF
jgi:lia operon protein LiaG